MRKVLSMIMPARMYECGLNEEKKLLTTSICLTQMFTGNIIIICEMYLLLPLHSLQEVTSKALKETFIPALKRVSNIASRIQERNYIDGSIVTRSVWIVAPTPLAGRNVVRGNPPPLLVPYLLKLAPPT